MKFPFLASCALLACLVTSACGDQSGAQPAEKSPVALPDNLCEAIPGNVVDRWGLTEVDHGTSEAQGVSEATCRMTGVYEGEQVTLVVDFESFGGQDAEAEKRVAEELASQCAELETQGGRFSEDENDCLLQPAAAAEPEPTTVVNIARAIPARGVVRVEMSHAGLGYQQVAPEVVGISTHLTVTEPSEL